MLLLPYGFCRAVLRLVLLHACQLSCVLLYRIMFLSFCWFMAHDWLIVKVFFRLLLAAVCGATVII